MNYILSEAENPMSVFMAELTPASESQTAITFPPKAA